MIFVNKMRGRAHHLGESLGLEYWNMMNQNATTCTSIDAVLERKRALYYEMLADPEIARLHHMSCDLHRQQIAQLREQPEMQELMQQMTSVSAENTAS